MLRTITTNQDNLIEVVRGCVQDGRPLAIYGGGGNIPPNFLLSIYFMAPVLQMCRSNKGSDRMDGPVLSTAEAVISFSTNIL